MKCPWQTITAKHAPTEDGTVTVKVTFGECLGAECPFFYIMGHTYGDGGELVEMQKCTRTDAAERRPI